MDVSDIFLWLESHDKLAGWAQFFGAMIALGVTYFTAFAPIWRRKRQLHDTALRLLAHGYESVESYHRTSARFEPFPLSIRQAALSMMAVSDDISRFPIFELDGQGAYSLARRLVAMSLALKSLKIFLDNLAFELDNREADVEDKNALRMMLEERLKLVHALATGAKLQRSEWPI